MTEEALEQKETFESFYKSFSYGNRSDLSFKFINGLSESEASEFFQKLLQAVVDGLDLNDQAGINRLILDWQKKAYDSPPKFTYDDGPFSPLEKPLSKATIGLLSSSGHFVKGDDPKPFGVDNMSQEEAVKRIMDFIKNKPILSEIPVTTPPEMLKVRHGGYDIRAAEQDPNSVFPYQRLKEMADDGDIGALSPIAYSFTGACSQLRLQKESIPEWLERFKRQNMDALILAPV